MRIGELAAMVGVSPRTVRHYHQVGLLPEPERLTNGYREYHLRDAVSLARVRRLAELGLPLERIRAVLVEDRNRDLREVLAELDTDLARQQAELQSRRDRLAELLAEADLDPDSTVSPEMASVLRGLPTTGSKIAQLDLHMLTLVDTASGPSDRARMAELLRPFTEPGAFEHGTALYARLDELAEAGRDDPRIGPLARDLTAHIPDEIAALPVVRLDDDERSRWLGMMAQDLSAAQVEVARLLLIALQERV